MFVDQIRIEVKAGKGGDGSVAFRHEKFVPMGGPSGGDGGRGGDVILVADEGVRTLLDFRYRRHFKADSGQNGQIKGMYGRGAENTYIKVPTGTSVTNFETGAFLGDLVEDGQELVVAKGGRGGRGNIHFKTSRNTAPEIAENGEPGQELTLQLELKILADVGLVGFPSVGKSTLLSVATSAKPKIAAYHFTTLVPNLGMVQLNDGRDYVMADLPGLITGAAQGVGLGIQFLRHIERTRVILHLVDMDPENGRDPWEDYQQIRHELEQYDEGLLNRPEIIVPTKMDIEGSAERLAEFKEQLAAKVDHEVTVLPISSITHDGVQVLLQTAGDVLERTPKAVLTTPVETDDVTYQYDDSKRDFEITETDEHVFTVTGERIEKFVKMTNLDHQDGIMRFARALQNWGIEEALRDAGAENGDTIVIADFSFDFVE
ncbi:obgE protein [Lapidilactobacillus dextrinicus DSM 20335]|uniref:GTPase Obg n=2 Tax=Lapidilactobacillus dextrinicus TaxID=51664 RepID=A0A0R2BI15_9LACO|nr:GTPase ObgE [Lapidilactobacillus dextrinicus]KRM79160.1 obgE protein [Lapidilactobacillus dextrinicus DSM 20335]QFG46994.1 GTPase ObgE [Lapidilactobacillus dextrinicus]